MGKLGANPIVQGHYVWPWAVGDVLFLLPIQPNAPHALARCEAWRPQRSLNFQGKYSISVQVVAIAICYTSHVGWREEA